MRATSTHREKHGSAKSNYYHITIDSSKSPTRRAVPTARTSSAIIQVGGTAESAADGDAAIGVCSALSHITTAGAKCQKRTRNLNYFSRLESSFRLLLPPIVTTPVRGPGLVLGKHLTYSSSANMHMLHRFQWPRETWLVMAQGNTIIKRFCFSLPSLS